MTTPIGVSGRRGIEIHWAALPLREPGARARGGRALVHLGSDGLRMNHRA
jgi:hypothetical protein